MCKQSVERGYLRGRITATQLKADSLFEVGIDNCWTRSAKGVLQVLSGPPRGRTYLVIKFVNQPKLNNTNCLIIAVRPIQLLLMMHSNVFRLRVFTQLR
jgi:hypothetical protein